ncbi:cytochrome c oxidase copper chaperone, putative [Plasmodium chabaudi chabaudi]|uniref:Cytochrome c oxidase copper chaperone, putative n=2 Tax=Plasmodium chabaudi TaxID=5825 RepID=A0A077XCW8_PLACU|nr:cytochrome c oxidase copper chaperone, putative [Plasmodium chabaudi chabaudi]SCM00296.1 cytochrome c oxidase copper chaperone, putative [Plasmodium chabaudi chabaudi]SCM07602.1 cytochrome c oxidase copper chaperone, putative [Plasmodium chabaudi adami]VTZ67436.1 cytochrome c oxidase copper chaperone, putative [Plasmodium chabaudi chabaudi]|eukprot:XP_016655177.1 cytochrome c oxidase copper chaperone, putative [Plasmodium chabaudi chabaudi]
MGSSLTILNTTDESKTGAPKKKICCVCLDTKKLRDECIVKYGEKKCKKYIDDHNRCLRNEGFDIK